MKTQIKLIIVIALLMTPLVILAQERGERGQRRSENRGEYRERGDRMAELLELTDEQKARIEEIRSSQLKTSLRTRNKLNEQRARLQTLRTEDVANMKEINRTIDNMASMEAELMKSREATHQEVRKILTEEQRIKFDTMRGRHLARLGERGRQGGGGPGRGPGGKGR